MNECKGKDGNEVISSIFIVDATNLANREANPSGFLIFMASANWLANMLKLAKNPARNLVKSCHFS